MKKLLFSLILGTAISLAAAAESVPVRFISLSVQIFPATSSQSPFGLDWEIALTSSGNPNSINHELAASLSESHPYTHEGFFALEDPITLEVIPMFFVLDIPIENFLAIEKAINPVTTDGVYITPDDEALPLTARWSRAAGESSGTVSLNLPDYGLRFENTFQLVAYDGSISFERSSNILSGSLTVTNFVDPQDTITGPLKMEVRGPSLLRYGATNWSNGAEGNYLVSTNFPLTSETNTFDSYWILEDGNLLTSEFDYLTWFLIIQSSDTNNNGQLDLTEDSIPPVEAPRLEVGRTAPGALELTVQGIVGQILTLQSANVISGGTWNTVETITLTNSTQKIAITGSGTRRFYRLRVN